jgi:hypothetical protein
MARWSQTAFRGGGALRMPSGGPINPALLEPGSERFRYATEKVIAFLPAADVGYSRGPRGDPVRDRDRTARCTLHVVIGMDKESLPASVR